MARVLIVDDDKRIAASVRRSLAYEGHEVGEGASGPAQVVGSLGDGSTQGETRTHARRPLSA